MSAHLLRQGALTFRTCSRRLAYSSRLYSSAAQPLVSRPLSIEETNVSSEHRKELDGTIEEEPPSGDVKLSQEKPRRKERRPKAISEEPALIGPGEQERVQSFLASLQLANPEPTLEDLEKHRPFKVAKSHTNKYQVQYRNLVNVLFRSFSKDQLRRFIEMYDLPPEFSRTTHKKVDYIEAIIEQQWKMPGLKEIERAKREKTEVVVKITPVTPSELFLILGKDGADLLHLSKKHNVHIAPIPKPLSLRVEGYLGKTQKFMDSISQIKKSITEDTFQLPTRIPIRPDLIQRLSRLAGAYIQNIGNNGLLRICAKDERALLNAKRLASRAIHELDESKDKPIFAYSPPSISSSPESHEEMYALYPFLIPRQLPWNMNTAGTFRMRRVGGFLDQSRSEDLSTTGGLAGNQGRTISTALDSVDIKAALLGTSLQSDIDSSQRSRTVHASLGNVLFTTQSTGQRASLIPPFTGPHSQPKILDWIKSIDNRRSFISSLPASLVGADPSKQKIMHRLVYRAISPNSSRQNPLTPSAVKTIGFELVLTNQLTPQPQTSDAEETSENPQFPDVSITLTPACWKGTEAELDLMMPDRPMDIRMTLYDTVNLPTSDIPSALQHYTTTLQDYLSTSSTREAQPEPPLMLYVEGDTYVLHTSATVRQSVEDILPEEGESRSTVDVISEALLDLETNQRSVACKIVCHDPTSETAWNQFLKHCDTLSTSSYRPPDAFNLDESSSDEL